MEIIATATGSAVGTLVLITVFPMPMLVFAVLYLPILVGFATLLAAISRV